MKPLLLKIQAFGPFVEKVELNFKSFENHRLFLIHGQTGAGKTTIFDAICYALYGETTHREGQKMRSAFAGDSVRTIVEYYFQIRDRFFYVKRELYVPKTRKKEDDAEEVKLINTQTFCETDKEGKSFGVVLTKVNEIEKMVKQVIGFNANQFKQIVILPQGKFDDLLRASTDEKMPILKEIFNAYLFERIADILDKTKKDFQEKTKEIRNGIEMQFSSVEDVTNEGELQEKIIEVENLIQEINKNLPEIENQYKLALSKYEQADTLFKDFKKYDEATEKLNTHLLEAENIQLDKNNFNTYEKAEKLRLPIVAFQNLQKEIITLKEKITNQEVEAEKLKTNLNKSIEEEQSNITYNESITSNNELIFKYEDLKPRYNEIINLNTELEKLIGTGKLKRNLIASLNEELKKLDSQDVTILEERKILEPIEKDKSGLEISVKNLKEIQTKHSKYLEIKKQFNQLKTETENIFNLYNSASSQNTSVEQKYSLLEQKWRKSQSALLALTLEDLKPCPVCGSLSHPLPATSTSETITDNELNIVKTEKEGAYLKYQEALKKYQEIKIEFSAAEAKVITMEDELKENSKKSFEELTNEFKILNDKYIAAQKAEIRIKEIDYQKNDIDISIIEKTNALNKTNDEIKDLLNTHNNTKEKLQILQSNIPDELKTLDLLLDKIKSIQLSNEEFKNKIDQNLKNKESLMKQLSTIEGSLETSNQTLKGLLEKSITEGANLKNLLLENNFETENVVEAYLKPESERILIKNKISDWESNRLKLETGQKTLFESVKDKIKPEVEILEKDLKEKDELYKINFSQLTSQNDLIKNLKKVQLKVIELKENYTGLQEQENHISILSDVANGKNPSKQKFETYVLSVFLDEVLLYANKRLDLLSQGRYHLLIKSKAGSRRDVTLDLEVFDHYNNKRRDVQSLSGGETFFTSLSLALGLADVATAKAGGIKLDAIFIDEGFGTLDAETLDLAIKTLTTLEGEHRMVGIISHVAELKERIPGRLEVIKGKNGSVLKISA